MFNIFSQIFSNLLYYIKWPQDGVVTISKVRNANDWTKVLKYINLYDIDVWECFDPSAVKSSQGKIKLFNSFKIKLIYIYEIVLTLYRKADKMALANELWIIYCGRTAPH